MARTPLKLLLVLELAVQERQMPKSRQVPLKFMKRAYAISFRMLALFVARLICLPDKRKPRLGGKSGVFYGGERL
jgi:hypothetical protein